MTIEHFNFAISITLEKRDVSLFQLSQKLPETAHNKLIKRLREFLFIGGMPEAVHAYSEKASLIDVTAVHRSIAETYQDDFRITGELK